VRGKKEFETSKNKIFFRNKWKVLHIEDKWYRSVLTEDLPNGTNSRSR
jgi:hypothetical protein